MSKQKISDYEFQKQLPASTDKEPEEIIDAESWYPADLGNFFGIFFMLPLEVYLFLGGLGVILLLCSFLSGNWIPPEWLLK